MIAASYMMIGCDRHKAEKERKKRELKEREVHALERIATALGVLLSLLSEKKGEQK